MPHLSDDEVKTQGSRLGADFEMMHRTHLWPVQELSFTSRRDGTTNQYILSVLSLKQMPDGCTDIFDDRAKFGMLIDAEGWDYCVLEKVLPPKQPSEAQVWQYESFSEIIAEGWVVD